MGNVTTILEASRLSGIHHKTLERLIKQIEKEKPEFDWQSWDWEAEGPEIRDFGGSERLEALKRRWGLGALISEKERVKKVEEWAEEEIDWLLSSKEGYKQLLERIYADSLSKRKKEQLKDRMLANPELATLIALYNGDEQDYAKRFLTEKILSPTAEIDEMLKADKIKLKSSRGWIKEINDIPLEKPVRSIDIVDKIVDFKLVASQPFKEHTVAVYKRKGEEPVRERRGPPKKITKGEPRIREPIIPKKSSQELIDRINRQHQYGEVKKRAKEHNIGASSKEIMLSKLLEKNAIDDWV